MPATLTSARASESRADESTKRATRAYVPLLALVLGTAWIAAGKARGSFDSDGWWRMRTGEVLLDDARLPRSDVFSWTAPGKSWRLNAWLYDLVAGTLERLGGRAAVSALMIVAIFAFAFVAYAFARAAGARAWPSAVTALLLTYVASPYQVERPQSLSFLLFPAAIVVARAALKGDTRATVALVPLFAVWANLHLTFTAGVLAVGVIAGSDVLANRRLGRPVVVAGLAALSGLLTPYGVGAYTAGLEVRDASRNIAEWQHIDPTNFVQAVALVVMAVGAVAMIRTRRWRILDVVLPIVLFAGLTIDAHRNIPFLVMLLAPELALAAPRVRERAWLAVRREPLTVGLMVGLVVATAMGVVSVEHFRPADPEKYPVQATAAIPAGCRLLNEYSHGGYIMYERWPDVAIAQDGRNDMYGFDLIQALDAVLDTDTGWQSWLDNNGVDCVLAHPDRKLVGELSSRGWTETARDPSGVLLERP